MFFLADLDDWFRGGVHLSAFSISTAWLMWLHIQLVVKLKLFALARRLNFILLKNISPRQSQLVLYFESGHYIALALGYLLLEV